MNIVSFGHSYKLPEYQRAEVDNEVKEARKMLGSIKPDSFGYSILNNRLSDIENEDKFAKKAEEEYNYIVESKKQLIRMHMEELAKLEADKNGSIASILGKKLRSALGRLEQDIQTQELYDSEGIHPNR